MKNYKTLTFKITLWMSIVALLPLAIGGIYINYYLKESLYKSEINGLKVVYRQAIERIDKEVRHNQAILESTAQIPLIAAELKKTVDGAKTIAVDPLIEKHIERIVTKHNYYDFFIISKTGTIAYSYKKESDFGENLLTGRLKNTALGEAFQAASYTLETSLVDISYYAPSKKEGAFAVAPIVSNGELLGFVGVQFDRELIFELVKSENGLGMSGEIVAGRLEADGRILAAVPLKYDKKAFDDKRVLNAKSFATGMQQAINGKNGAGVIVDYRGIKTLAVWGYEPNMKWGLVVKIDESEAMGSIQKQTNIMLTVFLASILLIAGVSISISKKITKPVNSLVASMEQFRIDFHHRAKVKENNEIGFLASEFNDMADNIGAQVEMLHSQAALLEEQSAEIEEHSQFLEERVEERTAELLRAQRNIDRYVSIIDRFVITTTTDKGGNITNASAAFCDTSGYKEDELIGKNHRILRDPKTPKELFEDLWRTVSNGKDWHGEMRNIAKDGSYYWVNAHISPVFNEDSEIVGYTAVGEDITDKKRAEEMAITDQLTGLYNRRHLEYELSKESDLHGRYDTHFSIIILDIDKFKSINDTFGHQAGDSVLKEISQMLKDHARATDVVGRWGGEEFLIILPQTTLENALIAAEHFRKIVENHGFASVGHKTASFGVAEYGGEMDAMIKRADDALYEAKSGGRNRVCG